MDNLNLKSIIGYRDTFDIMIAQSQKQGEEIAKVMRESALEKEKRYFAGVKREEKIIGILESIDTNTKVLKDVYKILNESSKYQNDILDFLNNLNMLAMEKNKTIRKSKYRKIMDGIKTTVSDINTLIVLFTYGEHIAHILDIKK